MTDTAREKTLDRVRKLFAQAEDQEGTPEGAAFEARALAMIAQYGIAETEARERRHEGPSPIQTVTVRFSGSYEKHQAILLQTLAQALHCSTIWTSSGHRTTIYGAAEHTDRVVMLFNILSLHMFRGAGRIRPNGYHNVVVSRRSYMSGFAAMIGKRLQDAEKTATESAAPGTGLVLVSDAERAKRARDGENPNMRNQRSRSQYDSSAGSAGAAAGKRVDLGGTAIRGARALTR